MKALSTAPPFFFFPLILYLLHFPSYNSSSQEKLGSLNTFVFFIIFYHVLEFFRLSKLIKTHYYLYSNRRKFPNFREFYFIRPKKVRFHFSLYFQSYSLYNNFLLNLASCHFFSLTRRITALLVNFSYLQADKSPASLIRKFPSLCFQYVCFSFSPALSRPLVWQSSNLRST